MAKLTIMTLTNSRIEKIMQEAAQAGDTVMVNDCKRALSTSSAIAARKRIIQAINEAAARATK